ncbi:MAG TPA: zf-HC2 domain-containing protein [Gemmatimonadales bacterium]|nr:zf-HC2 domain-containing protein [Gemmatimonadales bacterium]
MTDQWIDRLSEYLDGELDRATRGALEAHLASCAACRATLDELLDVVDHALALDDRPPTVDLWPRVAAQIGRAPAAPAVVDLAARRARRRFAFTVPQLVAAAAVLVLISGGTVWFGGRTGAPGPVATTPAPDEEPPPLVVNTGNQPLDAHYAAQVADLERALQRGRGRLDTTTVRVIEKNLGIIDRAIREAQSALAADPANSYLHLHLAQEMRRKLELLRQAATIAAARS